jgi:hypothetical protein
MPVAPVSTTSYIPINFLPQSNCMGAGLFRRTAPVSSLRATMLARSQFFIHDPTARNRTFRLPAFRGTPFPYSTRMAFGWGIDAGVEEGVTRSPGLVGGLFWVHFCRELVNLPCWRGRS